MEQNMPPYFFLGASKNLLVKGEGRLLEVLDEMYP